MEKGTEAAQTFSTGEVGHVYSQFRGIATVFGLPGAVIGERLLFEKSGQSGLVIGFDRDFLEVLIFGDFTKISSDEVVLRTQKQFSVPVGERFVGRVVSALGEPLDELGTIIPDANLEIERETPGIIDREPIHEPLLTGTKMIDALLPIGRGQRELILGDRRTGKSSLALDAIINQKNAKRRPYCVYCLIGQKEAVNAETIAILGREGALPYTVIVAASAASSVNEQYIAPFTACTIAEFFRDRGDDALVIFDDLTKHAWAWRQIALLLNRAPGREAYPGDIFYLHSRLLERAAKLNEERGSGSLTALPIIETQEGDITGFIPTNLISITDGQIYLDNGLFQAGYLPAINAGLSVSRVGSQAQPEVLSEVTEGLRLLLAQRAELKKLAEIEGTFGREGRERLRRGDILAEVLKQGRRDPLPLEKEVAIFYLASEGYLDELPVDTVSVIEKLLYDYLDGSYRSVADEIASNGLTDQAKDALTEILGKVTEEVG